jgi:preprotein translocase subunit YajC
MTDSTDNNTTIVATQVEDVAPAPDSIQSSIMSFVPLVLIFVVFYFLLIRPQEKRKKEIDSMLKTIKKGDQVITSSGIFGSVAKISEAESTLELEIANNVYIKILKSAIIDIPSRKVATTK